MFMNGVKIGTTSIVAPHKRILKELQKLPVEYAVEEVGAIVPGPVVCHPAT